MVSNGIITPGFESLLVVLLVSAVQKWGVRVLV